RPPIAASNRFSRPGGTATRVRAKGTGRRASSVQEMRGRPARGTSAFGSSRPRRAPIPAAATMRRRAMSSGQGVRGTARSPAALDREDLLLFGLQRLVDLGDPVVRQLLALLERPSLV